MIVRPPHDRVRPTEEAQVVRRIVVINRGEPAVRLIRAVRQFAAVERGMGRTARF